MKTVLRVRVACLAAALLGCCLLLAGALTGCASSGDGGGFFSFFSSIFAEKEHNGALENGTDPTQNEREQPGYFDAAGKLVAVDGELQELLHETVKAGQSTVNVLPYGMERAALQEEMNRFFFGSPELFYVEHSYSVYTVEGEETVARIVLKYKYEKEEIPAMVERYENALAEILSGVPVDGDDFDKLVYLHDYLVRHYAYDYAGMQQEKQTGTPVAVRDAYTFLQTGTGVCQAYMLTLIALCEAVEIPCLPVISDEMEHAWNLVQLGGAWYHVDVTWDDAGGADAPVYPSFNGYQYFLLSDEALFRAGREVKWVADAKADSALYDAALWHGATTPLRKLGECYYCVIYDGQDGTVKLYGGSATELGAVKVLDGARWYGKDGYYHAAWAGLAEYEGKLIFNTSTAFWSYDPTDGTLQKLADLALWPRDKQIFGICDLSPAGEISFVMAEDYHGAYEIRTWQIAIE